MLFLNASCPQALLSCRHEITISWTHLCRILHGLLVALCYDSDVMLPTHHNFRHVSWQLLSTEESDSDPEHGTWRCPDAVARIGYCWCMLMPFTQSLWARNVVYGERTGSSVFIFEKCNISQTLTLPFVLPDTRYLESGVMSKYIRWLVVTLRWTEKRTVPGLRISQQMTSESLRPPLTSLVPSGENSMCVIPPMWPRRRQRGVPFGSTYTPKDLV